jgi:hypothetical protein
MTTVQTPTDDLLIRLETLSLLIGSGDHACAVTVRDAITTIKAQGERLKEAEARYTVLLLDLLGNQDITTSRASELTRISVADIRRWSTETFKTGQQITFPFPAKDQP